MYAGLSVCSAAKVFVYSCVNAPPPCHLCWVPFSLQLGAQRGALQTDLQQLLQQSAELASRGGRAAKQAEGKDAAAGAAKRVLYTLQQAGGQLWGYLAPGVALEGSQQLVEHVAGEVLRDVLSKKVSIRGGGRGCEIRTGGLNSMAGPTCRNPSSVIFCGCSCQHVTARQTPGLFATGVSSHAVIVSVWCPGNPAAHAFQSVTHYRITCCRSRCYMQMAVVQGHCPPC